MKHKDTGMFNMPHIRGCDSVKLTFSSYELSRKPIKYWTNIGNINKSGSFHKIILLVKKIAGDHTANSCTYLYHYMGSRIIFPFQVCWRENEFDFYVYNCFGQNPISISRKVKSDNERFTKEEIKQITDYLCLQEHILMDGYNFFKDYVQDCKNYTDVRRVIKEIKEKL